MDPLLPQDLLVGAVQRSVDTPDSGTVACLQSFVLHPFHTTIVVFAKPGAMAVGRRRELAGGPSRLSVPASASERKTARVRLTTFAVRRAETVTGRPGRRL